LDNWTGATRALIERRLRPRGPVDALGLALEIVALAAFVGELIIWPPDSLDLKVLVIRVVTLLVNVVGYVVRRLGRKEPIFDYGHWP
jgi:hypothetical protein